MELIMAKKTPLPKNSSQGTTLGPSVSNALDLDDIDNLFSDSTTTKKKGSPITEFLSGLKSGFKNATKPQHLIKTFVRSASPDGYIRATGVYDDVMSGLSEIQDYVSQNNASDLLYLSRNAKDLLPKLKNYVPTAVFDRIDRGLEDQIENYQYNVETNRDRLAIRKRQDEENAESEVRAAIDQVSLVQQSIASKLEKAEAGRFALNQAERSIRDKVQGQRFNWLSKAMGLAVDGISRTANYNEQVNYNLTKKSLEVQFRSMLHLRKIQQNQEQTMELLTRGFTDLVRNTGLPDFRKSSAKDILMFNASSKTANNIIDRGIQSLPSFLGGFGQTVTDRGKQWSSSKIKELTNLARMGSIINSGDLWQQRYNVAGQLTGEALGGFARNSVLPYFSRMLRPKVEGLSNRYANGRHNQASYVLDNLPAIAQEYMNNYQNTYGARGILRNAMMPFVPQFTLQDQLKNGTYQTIDQQVGFNQLTQRSITEIIPGYLARILREVRINRTGNENEALEIFDITTGKFDVSDNVNNNALRRIVTPTSVRGSSAAITDAIQAFDPNNKLSVEARKTLAERLMRDANTNKRFDPKAYSRRAGYDQKADKAILDELSKFFKEEFNLDDRGYMPQTAENFARRNMMSGYLIDIRNFSRDPMDEINRLVNAGKTDQLRELGIITTIQGQDRINYPRIWELMRSEANYDYNATTDYSYFEEDQLSRLGNPTSKNFVGPQYKPKSAQYADSLLKQGKLKYTDTVNNFGKIFKGQDYKGLYNNLQDASKNAYNNALDYSQGKYNQLRGYDYNDALNYGRGMVDQVKNTDYRELADKARSKYSQVLNDGKDIVEDLYVKGTHSDPVIKAIDIINERLVDVRTGNVIKRIQDITGEVINSAGETVLTVQEAAVGLYNRRGELIYRAQQAFSDIRNRAEEIASKYKSRFAATIQDIKDKAQDWYLPGDSDPIITAKDLELGRFIDSITGKPIFNLKDVQGSILDRANNVVVSARTLANGLVSNLGERSDKVVNSQFVQKARNFFGSGTTTNKIFNAIRNSGKYVWNKVSGLVRDVFKNIDGYLPGRRDPVLRKKVLEENGYFDKQGKPLNSFDEIKDTVYDKDGDVVITADELGNVEDAQGKPHPVAKKKGLLRRAVGAAARGYWKMTKGYYKWLFGFGRGKGKTNKTPTPGEFESTTDNLLAGILNELQQTRKASEGPRKGSWQEKSQKATDTIKDAIKGKDTKDNKDQGILGRLGNLFKGIFKKKGDDEDDEGGLMDVLAGGGKTAGKGGILRRALPWIGAGAMGAASTAYTYSGYSDTGAAWNEKLLASVLSKFTLLGQVTPEKGIKSILSWRGASKTKTDFNNFRMYQMGAFTNNHRVIVYKLEELAKQFINKGIPSELKITAMPAKDILDIFGVTTKDPKIIQRLGNWLDFRFKPIFEAYFTGLAKLDQSNIDIHDIDSKLPDSLKGDLLKLVHFPYTGKTPYLVRDNPFNEDDEELPIGTKVIADTEKALAEKFGEFKKKSIEVDDLKAAPKDKKLKDTIKDKASENIKASSDTTPKTTDNQPVGIFKRLAAMVVDLIPTAVASDKISSLQSIRCRAYGIGPLDYVNVNGLLGLETYLIPNITVSNNKAEFKGDMNDLLIKVASTFGLSLADGTEQKNKTVKWVYERYLPVLKTFVAALRSVKSGVGLGKLETELSLAEKLQIANAVFGAVNEYDISIWNIPSAIDPETPLKDMQALAEAALNNLKKEAEGHLVETPTESKSSQIQGKNDARAGKSFATSVIDSIKSGVTGAINSVQSAASSAKERVTSTVNKVTNAASDSWYTAKYKLGLGGEVSPMGMSFGSLAKGNGGVWEQIPLPASNKSKAAAQPTFKAVSEMTGVPVELLNIFCAIESGFNYLAKAPTSSATGWFQFIDSTWDSMLAKYGSKFGIPPDNNERSLRLDPRINALMGAMFLKDNYEFLQSALGREPTDVDLYIAHFMGPNGARAFLTRDQNTIAAEVFPKQAASNRTIFYNKDGSPRTLGEIYALFEKKVARFRDGKSGTDVNAQTAGKSPEVEVEAKLKEESTDKFWKDNSMVTTTTKDALDKVIPAVPATAPTGVPNTPLVFPMSPDRDAKGQPPAAQTPSDLPASAQSQTTLRVAEDARRQKEVAASDARLVDLSYKQLQVQTAILNEVKNIIASRNANQSATGTASDGSNNMTSFNGTRQRAADQRPAPLPLK